VSSRKDVGIIINNDMQLLATFLYISFELLADYLAAMDGETLHCYFLY
jgi:hypothetical protein